MKTQPNLRFFSIFIILLGLSIAWSCQKDDPTPPPSTEKTISALSFEGVVQGASVDIKGTNIYVTVPYGTDITALAPTITLPKGATISPASGVKQDFTKPVTYTVTAEDGSKQTFTVTVTQGPAPKSSAKEIKSFVFKSFTPAISATIDSTAKTITATLPATADLTKLTPEITLSNKATVSPASGAVQDFSKDVTYIVTAEDGSKKAFVVSVKKEVEVAVDLNDLPDISGCLIKHVRIHFPSNPSEFDLQINYSYKNKEVSEIKYKEYKTYEGKGYTDAKTFSFSYKNNKLSYCLNEKKVEIYHPNYAQNTGEFYSITYPVNYSGNTGRIFLEPKYESGLIKSVYVDTDIAYSIEDINYKYKSNENIESLTDSIRYPVYKPNYHIELLFDYDNKNNPYKNYSNLFDGGYVVPDIYNYLIREYGSTLLYVFQNKNNIKQIKYVSRKYGIFNLKLDYTYNSSGYPTRASVSSRLPNGEKAYLDGAIVEFEYYCK